MWKITPHVCRRCLGWVVTDGRRHKCARCAAEAAAVDGICVCGVRLRTGKDAGLRCTARPATVSGYGADVGVASIVIAKPVSAEREMVRAIRSVIYSCRASTELEEIDFGNLPGELLDP